MNQSHNTYPQTKRSDQRGFTMIEMMIVVALISVITTLAYPSMRSIMQRQQDLDAASQLIELTQKTRAQATRRNRAYELRVSGVQANAPRGLVTIIEGGNNLCASLLNPEGRSLVREVPFGETEVQGEMPAKNAWVGLTGWRRDERAALANEPLSLCLSPSGSVNLFDNAGYLPLRGVLQVAVQPFMGDGNWRPFGPPRFVEYTYASGARLQLR